MMTTSLNDENTEIKLHLYHKWTELKRKILKITLRILDSEVKWIPLGQCHCKTNIYRSLYNISSCRKF